MTLMIAILDYDAGNIKSVEKAFHYIGEDTVLTRDFQKIRQADKVVLPGVGAFGDAMEHLKKYELDQMIREIVEEQKPLLGICLGLQLLFQESEESPGIEGLGILPGRIRKIPAAAGLKIPHIGWNSLQLKNQGRLFEGVSDGAYVYFVHSYYLVAKEEHMVKATTQYGVDIHASVEEGNVFACQFHPEKSSRVGFQILRNFASI
jgi:glutamine amidotransferase